MVATAAPPRPSYFREMQLNPEQLRTLFAPLSADYRATVVATAGLPNPERIEALRARLSLYSDALAEALGDAVDDAALIVRPRQKGGQR